MTVRRRRLQANSGSPAIGEPEFLVVGVLKRPHGLQGEMLMEVVTDFPERLSRGTKVYLGASHLPETIDTIRGHARGLLIRLHGWDSPESVETYRDQFVYVRSEDRPPLPAGKYYHHQLLGLRVHDDAGSRIGTLVEIMQTGANDVYVIRPSEGHDLLLPAISSVVLQIDLENHLIRVHVPDGIQVEDQDSPSRPKPRQVRAPRGRR